MIEQQHFLNFWSQSLKVINLAFFKSDCKGGELAWSSITSEVFSLCFVVFVRVVNIRQLEKKKYSKANKLVTVRYK